MSKMKKMFAIGALALTMGMAVTPQVSAYQALKTVKYDVNKYTGSYSNYHGHTYVGVPDWATWSGSQKQVIQSGWNYTRYYQVNYYGNWLW